MQSPSRSDDTTGGDEMTALLLPHIMDAIGSFIRLEGIPLHGRAHHGRARHGLGVERQESATTLQ